MNIFVAKRFRTIVAKWRTLMKTFHGKLPESKVPFRKLPTICVIAFFFIVVILLKRQNKVISDAPAMAVPACAGNEAMDFVKFCEEILHRDDVYADLSSLHDTHTYGSKKKLIKFALQKYISLDANKSSSKKTIRIVEIGAYRGEFTNEIANACTELPSDYKCAIIAIDIWDRIEDDAFSASIESFEAFKKNVVFFGNTKIIAPLRNSAAQAFALLKCHNVHIDIIYFDYSTSYSDTKEQLDQYHSLMNGNGVLFGATFCGPGAYRAVKIFAETNSHKLFNTTSINECTWMVVKDN